ncbi:histidinol phosphate aminotransferase apoenzyme [Paraoerskovia marina]|uniref:Histidinol-phosphate aminotransferase n=1 Tax=Paraoerskovia marina TaxID=545619 RepID=A0A1H1TN50_9CELL|nr:histidinol-phosphate transaminase [Paraoerskovia marina]SDS61582.1 histidinol phosphate aminotransferase apoenzyme [Paraoerskovia marina]
MALLDDSSTPHARLPVRPEHAGFAPYGAPQLDVPILLNVNENPYPPDDDVVRSVAADVADAVRGLNRYPDRDFLPLRSDLADFLARESGVRLVPEQLWAANGSNEIMLHVMQAFGGPGRAALSFAPTYSMYPEYARDTATRWLTIPRRDDFSLDVDAAVEAIETSAPAVVLIASPNNPTGTAMTLEGIARIAEAAARVTVRDPDGTAAGCGVVVVDEAYGEFRRTGTPSALELLGAHPNLAVSRTMSKAFALAGARVGYLAASVDLVDALRVVRLPYHLSGVTQAVARAALRHADVLLAQVDELRARRDETVAWLRRQTRAGVPLDVVESDANFVLFGRFDDRAEIWQGLLDRGVLIRVVGPDGYLRVSIGTAEEMTVFRSALVEVAGL